MCVETRFATHTEEDGVAVVSAEVNGFSVSELRFPPGYRQLSFEPECPYLAVVLEGSLEKIFPRRMVSLTRAEALVLAWAAAELACTDTPLAVIATNAGFADQSHFTRLFRHHLGITPARYRAQTGSSDSGES